MTIFNTPLDGALYLMQRGYKVFPIVPNGKKPMFEGWQDWAKECTYKDVEAYAKKQPNCNWGVECRSSNLVILDIDKKHDKDGYAALIPLEEKNGKLPTTFSVISPSGGKHVYFQGQGKSSSDKLAYGLDTRGAGGYVVAPGSIFEGKPYVIDKDEVAAALPDWIRKGVMREKVKEAPEGEIILKDGGRNNALASILGSVRALGIGKEALSALGHAINEHQNEAPMSSKEVEKVAESISKYAPKEAVAASDFMSFDKVMATRAEDIDPGRIPKRDWIMNGRYIGKFISVLIAPGGVGKSTISMLDAVSVCTGKDLTGFNIAKKGAVWLYNTEDPKEEIERRIAAVALHHKISLKEMGDLHFTSGRDTPLIMVKTDKNGVLINQNAIESVINYIKTHNIVLFIADPFVRTHEVNENDNMQIDKVVWCFQRIADATGCAIGLVHHSRKPGRSEAKGDMHTARGASALINAARIAHTIDTMEEKEAQNFGIEAEKACWYMRLDNAKANLQAPAERADWFKKVGVTLFNGDSVGTIERVALKDVSAEHDEEAFISNQQDLARYLNEKLQIGDSLSLNDMVTCLLSNPEYAHLFGRTKTLRRAIPKIVELLDRGLFYKGKMFISETGGGAFNKTRVICNEDAESYLG